MMKGALLRLVDSVLKGHKKVQTEGAVTLAACSWLVALDLLQLKPVWAIQLENASPLPMATTLQAHLQKQIAFFNGELEHPSTRSYPKDV